MAMRLRSIVLAAVAITQVQAQLGTKGSPKPIIGTCGELLTVTEQLSIAIENLQDRVKHRACLPGMHEDPDSGLCGYPGCTNSLYVEFNETATTDAGCETTNQGCCTVLKCYKDKSCLPKGAEQQFGVPILDGKPGDCTDDSFNYLKDMTNRDCTDLDKHFNKFGQWAHGQSVHALACVTGKGPKNVCTRPSRTSDSQNCTACHKGSSCITTVRSFMTLLDQSGERDCFDRPMLLLRETIATGQKGWENEKEKRWPEGMRVPTPNNFHYKRYDSCKAALAMKLYKCTDTVKKGALFKDYCPVTCNSCGKEETVRDDGAYLYKYDYNYVIPTPMKDRQAFDVDKMTLADVCSVSCGQCDKA